MNILLLARTGRRQRGGLKWAAALAKSALQSIGDNVTLWNVQNSPTAIPAKTDLVWVYGETRFVPELLTQTRARRIPLIVNSTHDGRPIRTKEIIGRSKGWGDGIYQIVFTDAAAAAYVRNQVPVVVIPNLFRGCPPNLRPSASPNRNHICIGDVKKALTPRFVGGFDVRKALQTIAETFPDIEVWGYRQYGLGKTDTPKELHISPFQESLPKWLSQFRVFVSFAQHETFAMVPLEAQAVGIPVLYRPMPQSLSAYLGPSAISFTTEDELIDSLREVYYREDIWKQMNRASTWNAKSKSPAVMGAILHLALSRVVHRHRREG